MIHILHKHPERVVHPEVARGRFAIQDFFDREVAGQVEGLGDLLGPLEGGVGGGFGDEEVAEEGPAVVVGQVSTFAFSRQAAG